MKLALFLILGGISLSWPAFYNGYPILFGDTDEYLNIPIEMLEVGWLSPAWARPPFYGILLLPIHWKMSLWPIVFFQGLVVSYFLHLAVRVATGVVDFRFLVAIIFILGLFTSLPWHVATLNPDVFAPLVILGMYLIAAGQGKLTSLEQFLVVAVTTVSSAVHYSHLALGVVLFGLTALFAFAGGIPRPMRFRALILALIPIVVTVSALSFLNYKVRGTAAVASHGSVFVLNKYRKIIKNYLEENCAEQQYTLCNHIDKFEPRSGTLLWDQGSLVAEVGAHRVNDEAKKIIRDSFQENAIDYGLIALKSTFLQLARFKTIDPAASWGGTEYHGESASEEHLALQHFPHEQTHFLTSRQRNAQLPRSEIGWIHEAAIIVCLPFFVFFFYNALKRRAKPLSWLYAYVLVGLLANAAICASLSGVVPRYQSRVVWLTVFITLIAAFMWRKTHSQRESSESFAEPQPPRS